MGFYIIMTNLQTEIKHPVKAYLLLLNVLALLAGCHGSSSEIESFTFRNLEIKYPGSLEISDEQEVAEKDYVSFLLTDRNDKQSRMEVGVSELAENFFDTVPQEELMGELAAEVDEMRQKASSPRNVTVLEESDIQWSEPPSYPEAFSFSKIQEQDSILYLAFSAKVVGNYCIYSFSRSPEPSALEVFNGILESISTKKSNP